MTLTKTFLFFCTLLLFTACSVDDDESSYMVRGQLLQRNSDTTTSVLSGAVLSLYSLQYESAGQLIVQDSSDSSGKYEMTVESLGEPVYKLTVSSSALPADSLYEEIISFESAPTEAGTPTLSLDYLFSVSE